MRWAVLALVTLAAHSSLAAEPAVKQKRVAVMPFEVGKGVDEGLGKTLSGALLGEIRKQRGAEVNLMAPDDVLQALPDALRGRLKRCAMATCKAQLAQAVSADRALGGRVSRVGSTVVLNLALLEAGDGSQVAQWTGKAPESSVDKLLDQLADAATALFPAPVVATPPAPTPAPVVATPTPEPVPPPPPPVVMVDPPMVAPILPPEDPPAVPLAPPPPSTNMVMAMQDPAGLNARSAAQQAVVQAEEEAGWSGKFIGAAFGVGVPLVAVSVLGLVVAVAGTVGSVASYQGARSINSEIKSVPHKNNTSFPLSSLILLGQTLERLTFVLLGVVAVAAVVGLIALASGVLAFGGLLVAAAPKNKKPAPAAPPPSSEPSMSFSPTGPAPAPQGAPR